MGAPGGPPPGGPAPAPAQRWNDPSAFAATAPPPTTDEHEGGQAAALVEPPAPGPSSPPPQERDEPATEIDAGDPLKVAPDAPRVLAGFLVSYEGDDLGTFYPLYQGKNVVGRKDAAEGLDIALDHPTTSSRHGVVHASARPGRAKIDDTGSTNGTFLNDEKIPHNSPHELADGDELRFGGYAVTVKLV